MIKLLVGILVIIIHVLSSHCKQKEEFKAKPEHSKSSKLHLRDSSKCQFNLLPNINCLDIISTGPLFLLLLLLKKKMDFDIWGGLCSGRSEA